MSDIRFLNYSFGGGVVTPEFFGRIDDSKYQSGLAKCTNFIVLPHGPVTNRGGTKFVREVKHSDRATRMIPFTFSTTQTYAIELGHQYMRFHTMGATLGPSGSTVTYDNATAYVIGDIVASSGTNYYCIANTTGNAPPNATYWYAMPDGILEIPTDYDEDDIFDMHYVQSNDVLSITHPNYTPAELKRFIPSGDTPYSFALTDIAFASDLSAPTGVTATASTGSGSTTYKYKVSAVGEDGVEESLPSAVADVTNDLLTSGNENTIDWTAVSGASRYNIYLQDNGLYGFIGQTDATEFVDNNISADISKTPPIQNLPFTGAGNYPSEVSYFEQRRVFAATDTLSQNFWMTRSGTESNLSYSIPFRDTDSVRFKIVAREANRIRHIIPLADMIILTASAEWRITSINTDAITPDSISIKPQSYVGASNVRPITVNNNIVFEADRGSHWREFAYQEAAGGYLTGDISLRAPHLFDNYTMKDMAYAKAPYPIIWGASSSGDLIGLTYIPEQDIGAFHVHNTRTSASASKFMSVCTVAEGDDDPFYAIVEREIDGATVQYVERYEPRAFETNEDAYFVDCGATLDNPISITGITNADPAVITTASAHGLSNGDKLDLRDIVAVGSSTDTLMSSLNNLQFKAANVTSTTFELQTAEDTPVGVDTSAFTAYKSGGTVRKAVATISSGLDHLEGEEVSILANGSVEASQTVTGGSITLDNASSIIHVGLPITADVETLPLYIVSDQALGQGTLKNVNRVRLRVYESSGIFAGPDFDTLVEYKQRTDENFGVPPSYKSQELDPILLDGSWTDSGSIAIRQTAPLPLTIASMTLEVAVGG